MGRGDLFHLWDFLFLFFHGNVSAFGKNQMLIRVCFTLVSLQNYICRFKDGQDFPQSQAFQGWTLWRLAFYALVSLKAIGRRKRLVC